MPYKILDAHTHHFPITSGADVSVWASENKEPHWGELMSGNDLQDWPSEKAFLEQMDKDGIEQAVLLGWYWENPSTCRLHNEHYAKLLASQPDRFIAFASVCPHSKESILEELSFCLDKGFSGVGECLPAVQGGFLLDEEWETIALFATENNWPMSLHVTEPVGHDYKGRVETPLCDYVDFAAKHPNLKIILAHWAGLLPFFELNASVAAKLSNVYYDTAASPLLYNSRIWQLAAQVVSPHKLLFGSDYPLRLYPSKDKKANFISLINEVKSSGLSENDLTRLFAENLQSLLPALRK